ncbi:hypothetical protein C5167_000739 [Papaver somniferum]|uniref:Uncharacterized protein n=1 Tax=Papaver somniferum TaxID=3469 RepID=A0A4Y7KTC9_PAPSO|nr:hypothetical protein C5167_000739 [Papaver somniferum]
MMGGGISDARNDWGFTTLPEAESSVSGCKRLPVRSGMFLESVSKDGGYGEKLGFCLECVSSHVRLFCFGLLVLDWLFTGRGKSSWSVVVTKVTKGCLGGEFMPSDTLAKHLFYLLRLQSTYFILKLGMIVLPQVLMARKVVLGIKQLLTPKGGKDPCKRRQHVKQISKIYWEGNSRFSCYGMMKDNIDGNSYRTNLAFTPPESLRTGGDCTKEVVLGIKRPLQVEATSQIYRVSFVQFL